MWGVCGEGQAREAPGGKWQPRLTLPQRTQQMPSTAALLRADRQDQELGATNRWLGCTHCGT